MLTEDERNRAQAMREDAQRLYEAADGEIRSAQAVLLTAGEYAAIERVTVRTVRRWISKGAVSVRRTPGGGIRIVRPRAQMT